MVGEELAGVLDGHRQHVRDRLAAVGDLERLPVVPRAAADLAVDVDIGEEVHLDLLEALALAGLAPATALLGPHVEAEASGRVPADLGFLGRREDPADLVEDARVGGGVGSGGAADRRLVDLDHAVDAHAPPPGRESRDPGVGAHAGPGCAAGQDLPRRLEQYVVHQRRLAGARHARDAHDSAPAFPPSPPSAPPGRPDREHGVDALEVVLAGAADDDGPAFIHRSALLGDLDPSAPAEVLPRQRTRLGDDVRDRSLRHDAPAVHPRSRPDVQHVVRVPDHVLVVFNHQHGVPDVGKVPQRRDQARVVPLVQPDRWLVEHVARADEFRAHLRRQTDALRLAAGERPRLSVQREVLQPHAGEEPQPRQHLLEDRLGDRRVLGRKSELLQVIDRVEDGEPGEVGDVEVGRSGATE